MYVYNASKVDIDIEAYLYIHFVTLCLVEHEQACLHIFMCMHHFVYVYFKGNQQIFNFQLGVQFKSKRETERESERATERKQK